MMNILIVEDELPARDSLKADVCAIIKEKINLCVAENGAEALKITKNFHPDILLTDIRMPHMLGTELAERIADKFPKCKIIFLSGYSDKDFFKSAIKLGAVDYLEKPIDSSELKIALDKAILSINTSKEYNTTASAMTLRDAFKNKEITTPLVPQKAFFVAVILSPCTEYFSAVPDMINNIARNNELNVICYKKSNGVIEMLLHSFDSSLKPRIDAFFTRLFHELSENERFKCAVGSIESDQKDIYKSYQNAVCASDRAFFHTANNVIYYDEIAPNSVDNTDVYDNIVKDIYSYLTNDNLHSAINSANNLYNTLCDTPTFSTTAKKIYYGLFQSITDYYENFFQLQSTENIVTYQTSAAFDTQFLSDLHSHLLLLLNSSKTLLPIPKGNIANLAIFYLEQHYSNPLLSISDIVHFCKINSTQLCNEFKEKTGLTINQFLTQVRINAAKKLLTESDYKIDTVASMCGFNDSKYFGKVFKKHTGLLPSEYKRKNN